MTHPQSTRAGGSQFAWNGSPAHGFHLLYGSQGHLRITPGQWRTLCQHFAGRTVAVGTSFDNPPPHSLGAWLQAEWSHGTAIASYIAPLLIVHDAASPVDERHIRFV